jgi:uncharacterized membrane protein YfcA
MTPEGMLAVLAAGFAAGTVNTIVGSGSLITFPTLLALGYPAVLANVTNTVGIFPGSISGAIGYRRELVGQRRRLIAFCALGAVGGATGGVALLVLPKSDFRLVVPYLILLACALIIAQPRLTRLLARRTSRRGNMGVLAVATFLTAVYGGYFGAAQGVLFIALFAIFMTEELQVLNGIKNAVAAFVNASAAVLFVAVTHVAWLAAGLLAVGSIAGAQLGAVLGRRLRPMWLRAAIVVVGLVVAIQLLVG